MSKRMGLSIAGGIVGGGTFYSVAAALTGQTAAAVVALALAVMGVYALVVMNW